MSKLKFFVSPSTLLLVLTMIAIPGFALAEEPIIGGPSILEEPSAVSIPGTLEGTGTSFEITDSEYLNISLQSTEEITVRLESAPKTISLNLEASSVASSTTLTIGNLEPNTLYSKFEDSYKNKVEFTTNETGAYSWTQDLTKVHHVWFQPGINGTIFLPTDCTKYGTWDSTTSTCTLTKDLFESVEITINNVILDCNNYKISGNQTGRGIYLSNREHVAIKNCTVTRFSYGAYLLYSNYNTFANNSGIENYYGIVLTGSRNNILTDNVVLKNSFGISIYDSRYNNLTHNRMSNNRYNFYLTGHYDFDFPNSIDTSNTVDDKPIYYIQNAANRVYDSSTNAGTFYCISCRNVTVKDLTLTNNGNGVFFWGTENSRIENVTTSNNYYGIHIYTSLYNALTSNVASDNYYGISLEHSSYITLTNNIASNNYYGISLYRYRLPEDGYNVLINNIASNNRKQGISLLESGNKNTLDGNTASNNYYDGIYLSRSSNNTLINNTTNLNRQFGICLSSSSSNTLTKNTVSRNYSYYVFTAILLSSSDNNILTDNNVTLNGFRGIYLDYSNNNKIYHNNFKDNKTKPQAWIVGGTGNLFDNGYPADFNPTLHGGNYWSDYTGADLKRGPNQDQPGSDGIGDTSYTFTGGQDKYPFMKENGWLVPVNQPPVCSIKLREKGTTSLIDKVDIGESFDIYAGDSTDDTGLKEVRFLSDDFQDNNPTGEWTEWYNWESSSGDWDALTKIRAWSFAITGDKEVWVELKDDIGQTSKCFANISVIPWSFANITDLHIGRGYPDYDGTSYEDNGEGEDYYLPERLKRAVNWINENKNKPEYNIKFVAVLGDIADSAEKSEFLKAKNILDKLNDPNQDGNIEDGIPHVFIFGNHDVWPYTNEFEASYSQGEEFFEEVFWDTSGTNFQLINKFFGASWKKDEANSKYKNFSFSYKGMNFIGLDFNSRIHIPSLGWTVGVGATAVISSETENWLKDCLETHMNCLKGYEENSYIIFSHILLAESSVNGFSSGGWACSQSKRLCIPESLPCRLGEGECVYFPGDFDRIKEIIKDKNVLANFGGHIHGFYPRPIIGGDFFMDANEEDYPSISTTSIITTESLMVGSNRENEYLKEHDKGIIKIVKVLGENKIDYKINEGKYKPETGEGKEFIALNPYINDLDYKSLSGEPCMGFYGHAFTKREPSLSWEVDGEKVGSGEKTEYCFPEVPKIYEVKLTTIDKENPEIKESIFRKILVKAGIIPKFIKGVKETIEVISTTLGEKLTEFGRTVKDTVLIRTRHSEAAPVGLITVHFEEATEDIDLSMMVADVDLNKKKSVLYMPSWPKTIEESKVLFIPK